MFTLAISKQRPTPGVDATEDYTLRFACNVVRLLARESIAADVTPRFTSTKGRVKAGALVAVYEDVDVADVWANLRDTFGLTCAWLETEGFSGCVKEYLATKGDA